MSHEEGGSFVRVLKIPHGNAILTGASARRADARCRDADDAVLQGKGDAVFAPRPSEHDPMDLLSLSSDAAPARCFVSGALSAGM